MSRSLSRENEGLCSDTKTDTLVRRPTADVIVGCGGGPQNCTVASPPMDSDSHRGVAAEPAPLEATPGLSWLVDHKAMASSQSAYGGHGISGCRDSRGLARTQECAEEEEEATTDDGYRSASERTTPRHRDRDSPSLQSVASSVSTGEWQRAQICASGPDDGRGLLAPCAASPRGAVRKGSRTSAPWGGLHPGRAPPLIRWKDSARSTSTRTQTPDSLAEGALEVAHLGGASRLDLDHHHLGGDTDPAQWESSSPITTISDDPLNFSVPLHRQRTRQLSMELSSSSSAVGGHHVTLTQGATFLKQSGSRREEAFYAAIQSAQQALVKLAVRHTPRILHEWQRKHTAADALKSADLSAAVGVVSGTVSTSTAPAARLHAASTFLHDVQGVTDSPLTHDTAGRLRSNGSSTLQPAFDVSGERWLRGYRTLLWHDAAAADAVLSAQSTHGLLPMQAHTLTPRVAHSSIGTTGSSWGSPMTVTTANTDTTSPRERRLCSPVHVPAPRLGAVTAIDAESGLDGVGGSVASDDLSLTGAYHPRGAASGDVPVSSSSMALSAREECMVRLAASMWWMVPALFSAEEVVHRDDDTVAVEGAAHDDSDPHDILTLSEREALAQLAPFVPRFFGLRHIPLAAVSRAAATRTAVALPAASFATTNVATVVKSASTAATAAAAAAANGMLPDLPSVGQLDTTRDGALCGCHRTAEQDSHDGAARPHDADAYEEEDAPSALAGTPGGATVRMITLEDVCFGFVRPCVLDVKMGCRQYGLNPTLAKRQSKQRKAALSTSAAHGIRLAGFKCWETASQSYAQRSKFQCRSLSLEEVRADVHRFLRHDEVLHRVFHAQVARLLDAFKQQSAYRFYTSSLLFVYDAEYPVETARITMVDFAYTYQHTELQRECDEDQQQDRDEGYLRGLRTLLEILVEPPLS